MFLQSNGFNREHMNMAYTQKEYSEERVFVKPEDMFRCYKTSKKKGMSPTAL